MNDDPFAERDVADDLLAAKRIAARARVVRRLSTPLTTIASSPRPINFLTAFTPVFRSRLFLLLGVEFVEFFGAEKFCQNVSRQGLAVSNRCKQIVRPAQAIFVRDPLHLGLIVEKLFRRNAKLVRFFFQQLAADIDRFGPLLLERSSDGYGCGPLT